MDCFFIALKYRVCEIFRTFRFSRFLHVSFFKSSTFRFAGFKKVEAFYPTLKNTKVVNGKRVSIEESRIPNLLFARGTEEEIQSFVYDNVNLPFLRFYYRHTHIGKKRTKESLIVPDCQMNTLMVVCAAETDDIIASTEEITKFKEGQMVRITDGKFKGVVGTVARYKSQQRVGIVIEGLLTVCTAYVPSAFIEKII